jgi:hypothetical protein
MVKFQPFAGATNRTATFVLQKGQSTSYPVPYVVWDTVSTPSEDMPLSKVLEITTQLELQAHLVREEDRSSPWQVSSGADRISISHLAGKSSYVARKGVSTSANAVYWLEFLSQAGNSNYMVRNVTAGAKKKVAEEVFSLEADACYPMVRGKDVHKWLSQQSLYIVFPHEAGRGIHAIPEKTFRRTSPLAYQWLKSHESLLQARKEYAKFLEPQGDVAAHLRV